MGYGGREKTCENSWVLVFCAVSGWDSTVAGNGDVVPPGWRGFGEEDPGIKPEKNANFGVILLCGIVSRWNCGIIFTNARWYAQTEQNGPCGRHGDFSYRFDGNGMGIGPF